VSPILVQQWIVAIYLYTHDSRASHFSARHGAVCYSKSLPGLQIVVILRQECKEICASTEYIHYMSHTLFRSRPHFRKHFTRKYKYECGRNLFFMHIDRNCPSLTGLMASSTNVSIIGKGAFAGFRILARLFVMVIESPIHKSVIIPSLLSRALLNQRLNVAFGINNVFTRQMTHMSSILSAKHAPLSISHRMNGTVSLELLDTRFDQGAVNRQHGKKARA